MLDLRRWMLDFKSTYCISFIYENIRVSGIGHQTLIIEYRVSNIGNQVSNIKYQALSIKYQDFYDKLHNI